MPVANLDGKNLIKFEKLKGRLLEGIESLSDIVQINKWAFPDFVARDIVNKPVFFMTNLGSFRNYFLGILEFSIDSSVNSRTLKFKGDITNNSMNLSLSEILSKQYSISFEAKRSGKIYFGGIDCPEYYGPVTLEHLVPKDVNAYHDTFRYLRD